MSIRALQRSFGRTSELATKLRLINEKICITIRLIKSVISTHTRRNSTFGRDVLRQVQEEGYS